MDIRKSKTEIIMKPIHSPNCPHYRPASSTLLEEPRRSPRQTRWLSPACRGAGCREPPPRVRLSSGGESRLSPARAATGDGPRDSRELSEFGAQVLC